MDIDHPSFNPELYQMALTYALEQAGSFGLGFEVEIWYNDSIRDAFNTDRYPLTRNDYLQHADEALYEWDI